MSFTVDGSFGVSGDSASPGRRTNLSIFPCGSRDLLILRLAINDFECGSHFSVG